MIKLLKSLSLRWTLAVVLIVAGLALTIVFGLRAFRSFQEVRYIREQGLDVGTADLDAIRGWMTIGFIGVAYGVPEEYIFAELDIPYERRNQHETLGHLSREYRLGKPPLAEDLVKEAILKYRENPVATGLDDVRPWMSLRYIANSTGVPEDYLFEQLGLPQAGNEGKPLDRLDDEYKFGGRREIVEAVEAALADYEANHESE
ncbi:MAG TPA: hypothetical protein PKE64_09460 [Anaerolineae bacterium]|nr:hypothetical protein [Anaerolineae bacterium]HMR64223.1 hypothetical protein [Anaerolineae bacterium]